MPFLGHTLPLPVVERGTHRWHSIKDVLKRLRGDWINRWIGFLNGFLPRFVRSCCPLNVWRVLLCRFFSSPLFRFIYAFFFSSPYIFFPFIFLSRFARRISPGHAIHDTWTWREERAINRAWKSDVPATMKMKCKYRCVALRSRPVYNCPRSEFEVNEIRYRGAVRWRACIFRTVYAK